MAKESVAMIGFEACGAADDGRLQGFKGPGGFEMEVAFQFDEGHLDRGLDWGCREAGNAAALRVPQSAW